MTLTLEQRKALTDLMAHVPRAPTVEAPTLVNEDLLKGLTGLSGDDVQKGLLSLLTRKDALEQWLLSAVERNPLEASGQFLGLASLAFYAVEKNENPKIKTLVDAFYFISTCASVGYADVFPVTQLGRTIASLVMTVGPALTAKALDGRKS
jgi:hypothetical protein